MDHQWVAALRTVAATFNQPDTVVDYVVSGDGTIAGLGPADRIEAWLIWGRNQTVFKRFGRDAMLEFFARNRGRRSWLADDEAEAWRMFYSGLASVDVAVIGRWANVVETAMDVDPALGSVGGRHWLEGVGRSLRFGRRIWATRRKPQGWAWGPGHRAGGRGG